MSGIFGILHFGETPVAAADLDAMAEALRHRGPDGIRHHCQEGIGLGHAMLHTTPESLHETLPFWDDAVGLAITADARIDNREQLLAEVPGSSTEQGVITDSQLILLAYRKWGEACVDHLLGDFAFVIWNSQKQQLFCARDHMGCKPFYYHFSNGLFVFASSAIAVARVPVVAPTLDEGRVADFLVKDLEGIDKTSTFYNEVKRLPPAHAGIFTRSGPKFQRYWELEAGPELQLDSDEAYLEAFTRVYSEAVRCRMRSNTEPVAMLSGGLDSSTIVGLARDMRRAEGLAPLKTFSGISDQVEGCVESQCSLAVAQQGGIDAKFVRVSEIVDQGLSFRCAMEYLEDPFDTYMAHIALPCQWTAQAGFRVVLDGLDGDLVAGLPMDHSLYLLRQGQWREAWQEAKGLSRRCYLGNPSHLALFFRALGGWAAPAGLKAIKRTIVASRAHRRLLKNTLISPAFARRVGLQERMKTFANQWRAADTAGIAAKHKKALEGGNLTVAVERYERVASYYGVEARHPLLDKRVVEFCLRLPWRLKTRDGWTKYVLRRLAGELLPSQVAWRAGTGFGLGWDFNAELLREFAVADDLDRSTTRLATEGYVNGSLTFESLGDIMCASDIETISSWWQLHSLDHFFQRSGLG
jgi:asparagine synthase (glutamine-hydrolysing)